VRRRLFTVLAVATALMAGCGSGEDGSPGEPAASPPGVGPPPAMLLQQLRRGGHVIAFRHAATETAVDTTDDLSDCSRQRNLDDEGREQSRAIGAAFERLDIPIGVVLASPFCRARDTARLAFGSDRTTRALLGEEFFDSPAEARREGMPRLLRKQPRERTNTVLVSHGSAIFAATEVNPEEGAAVVVRPRAGGDVEVVATVDADEWQLLEPGRDHP
jgi:phosphohistidine phosphatase SixA